MAEWLPIAVGALVTGIAFVLADGAPSGLVWSLIAALLLGTMAGALTLALGPFLPALPWQDSALPAPDPSEVGLNSPSVRVRRQTSVVYREVTDDTSGVFPLIPPAVPNTLA